MMTLISIVNFRFALILAFCVVPGLGVVIDCYRETVDKYDGHQQTTQDGTPCVKWDSVGKNYTKPKYNFPDASIYDAANFCRAMDHDYIWCWTSIDESYRCNITKCGDNIVSKCGTVEIEQPALLGRNVTFTFTPDSRDPKAILEWQRKNEENPWFTRPFTSKFIQYQKNGIYYMILTNSEANKDNNDEVFYRIHYYNESTQCLMEISSKLTLNDKERNPCGFVYQRNIRVVEDEDVTLEYYPSENTNGSQHKWFRSRNLQSSEIKLVNDLYTEERKENGMFELTIHMIKERMNGSYGVRCDKEVGFTNNVSISVLVAPSKPKFLDLKNIGSCEECLVHYHNEGTKVHCQANGGTKPIKAVVTVENEPFHVSHNDSLNNTDVYTVSVQIENRYHNASVTCSISNGALATPLTTSRKIYVIKSPDVAISVPGEIRERSSDAISCLVSNSRPAPQVYFNISGTKVTSALLDTVLKKQDSSYTVNATLKTIKREWNGKNISCCRYSAWFKTPRNCSEPKAITLLYPPETKFNISGSKLDVPKGVTAHVKCSADSFPVSTITWIEESDEGEVIKEECEADTDCVLEIDFDVISKQRFVCAVLYLEKHYNKTLNVNIYTPRKGELSDNDGGGVSTNIILTGIIVGVCSALVLIVLVIIMRKKRNNARAKQETKLTGHSNESHPSRRNTEAEPQHVNAYAADEMDVTYSQPMKKRKVSVENEPTYSEVNKAGKSNNQVPKYSAEKERLEDGQLMYVELDFDAKGSAPKASAGNRRNSAVEYVGIDFAKTAADVENGGDTPEIIYANQ